MLFPLALQIQHLNFAYHKGAMLIMSISFHFLAYKIATEVKNVRKFWQKHSSFFSCTSSRELTVPLWEQEMSVAVGFLGMFSEKYTCQV